MSKDKHINWESLSWVEMSSGIEVLYLAKFFRGSQGTHSGILRHALDEYRHGSYFRDFAKRFSGLSKISSNINLTESGGLKNSQFPISANQLVDICSYLKIGEQRALKSNTDLINICVDEDVLIKLKEIQGDEANHERGLDGFLKKYPIRSRIYYIKNRIKFFLVDFLSLGILTKMKNITDGRIIKMVYAILPEEALDLRANDESLEKSILNRFSSV